MKIKIRTQSLGDIDVDIPQTSRVSALRPIVAERTGLDAATLRFIFHGRVLDDNDLLTERGVNDGTTVLMVTRRPPTATDSMASQNRGADEVGNRREPITANFVNAEISIMRTGFLSDGQATETLIRDAVQRFATPFNNSLSWEVQSVENLPQQGDLTILVRLLGNETNHPSSGARARILRITDVLSRIILAMQVIKEDLCQMVDDVVARRYLVNDESFARLDECVLRLEETLLVPRAQEVISSRATVAQESSGTPIETSVTPEGPPSSASGTNGGQNTSLRNVTRHSTRLHYSQLLSHVIATQADFSAQVSSYQAVLRNPQIFCLDEYSRCVAEVFQEHTRRMFHCFGHVFHCLSDISASFETSEQDQLRPLTPESESPFRTEAVFRIVALTGEESRIRTLGQQAAQAFHFATHQPPMRNVRMQIFGDVRMCRLPTNANVDARLPVFSAAVPRFTSNQSFVQFPTPVQNFVGPLDFNVLQRLFPPPSSSSRSPSSCSAPSTSAAPTSSSVTSDSSKAQKPETASASTSSLNVAAQQTGVTNGTTSINARRLSMLHALFTETFSHLLANRARTSTNREPAEAANSNATSSTVAVETPHLSRSGSGSLIFQGLNIPLSHSASAMQPSQHPMGPGVISQFVVETDGPEEARQLINAAMQAIGGTVGAHQTVGSTLSTNPRMISSQIRPISGEVFPGRLEASRRYPVMRMTNVPGVPQAWLSGPVYATDRYLPCRSNFASTNPETNRTRNYQIALRTIREAALRYERSLSENSEQRNEAELITDRWSALRESDERHTRRILGGNVAEIGTMQNDPAQFQRVLGNILERIVHQMAVTDPDIAEDLGTSRNDFESYFNDLTSEMRNNRSGNNSHDNLASTSQEAEQQLSHNVPSTSNQSSSTLHRVNSEPTLTTQNSTRMSSEGGDARWTRELQVLHLIADILNAPGGATVGQFLRREGYQYSHTGGGFINLLITMCCEVLDTTDFMRLLSGDLSTFGTYRQQMRRYIIEHVLDDNSRPSSEDLESVSRRFQLAETVLNRLFEADPNLRRFVDVPEIGRVDVAASALNIDRLFLQRLLSLLINNSDGFSANDFAKQLSELFSGYFRRFVAIANLSSNSSSGYSDVLMQLTRSDGYRDDNQRQVRAAISVSPEARSDYLLMRNLMESSLPRLEAYLREEAPFSLADIVDELVLVDATSEELSWSTDSAETVIAAESRNCEKEDERSFGVLRSGSSSKNQTLFRKVKDKKHDLTCFPESWMRVIEEDICCQLRRTSSNRLSQAYLSGDPFLQNSSKNNGNARACGNSSLVTRNEDSTTVENKLKQNSEDRKEEETNGADVKKEGDIASMEIDPNEPVDEQAKFSKTR